MYKKLPNREKSSLKKLKELLPNNAVSTIHKKIKQKVGKRQIQKVLNGECEDRHGIINIALDILEIKKNTAKRLKQLAA